MRAQPIGLVSGVRFGADGQLVAWFEAEILHGPGAFYVEADSFEDYERAMTAKLLRELELQLASDQSTAGEAG